MADFSLEDLQAALQEVQKEKSSARLSERNVVELITKLQDLGLLSEALLHSVTGREYLTEARLREEVGDALHQSGGRLALVDLPTLLGVDFVHCERAAAQAVEDDPDLLHIGGELITAAHLEGLAREANQLLQESGVVAIGELAQLYKLSTELMQGLVEEKLGSLIQGRLHSGIIFTEAYVGRVKCQLRGALRGALRPVQMQQLHRTLGLQVSAGLAGRGAPTSALVEELVREQALQGSLRAGGEVWVPAAHLRAQQDAVLTFFNQNQYIEYSMLSKLGVVDNQLEYIYPLVPEGFALQSAFVDAALLERVEAAASDALVDSSWVDVHPLLPPALNSQDAALLLAECETVEGLGKGGAKRAAEGQVLSATCLVSAEFQAALEEKACNAARSLAAEALEDRKRASTAASTSAPEPSSHSTGKGATAAAEAADDSDDDWGPSGKGSARKKKGSKRKGGAPGKTKASSSSTAAAPRQRGQAQQAEHSRHRERLMPEALAELLVEWEPELEGAGEDGGLALALAQELRRPALAAFDQAMQAVFTAGAEARRRQREAIEARLEQAWKNMQATAHGVQALSEALQEPDSAACRAVERHAVRTRGADTADCLLQLLQVDMHEDAQDAQPPGGISAAERTALLNKLPDHLSKAARHAADTANGSDLQAAVAAVQALSEAAGVRLAKLERKAEKGLVAAHAQALRLQLATEEDPAAALSQAIPVLLARALGVLLSIPGKAIGAVTTLLQKHLNETDHQHLSRFHKLVVEQLLSDVKDEGIEQELQSLVPVLRHMAGIDANQTAHQ
ncbi:hypothetical protein WJX73_008997 [Symbiochloris irregularis]|uniref:E3 UFM1-protein ligase 1 n=1 Tax=Symbiochloris irregularis TaxID=706552 RepID=A0AAW1P2B7_9CHLO